jgi:hypothetical protein
MSPLLENMPPEDRVRSPHTGWVRAHWEATADHVLAAVRASTSPAGALVRTSDDQSLTVGMEGFARASLLAAYRATGSTDPDVREPLLGWLGRGIDVGTRDGHAEAWPRPADLHQSIVEAAWLAIALSETRELLWNRLEGDVRRRVVEWFAEVQGKVVPRNNWLLYPVIVSAFLDLVGGPADPAGTARALGAVEAMYHADGWYSDGTGTNFGHYSAWGMQLLLGHWLRMSGGSAFPGGPDVVRDRLAEFLREYAHLIGEDGAPVVHGRSAVYRCAVAAPFWLGTVLGSTPFDDGVTRCLTSRVLRHFVAHGAFDAGIPPLGWYGEFRPIADGYSSTVSPLLVSQAFVGLLLPDDHPAWTSVETPVPYDSAVAALRVPGFLCTRDLAGTVRVASHGATAPSVVGHPGYRKVAYSNRTAPCRGSLGSRDLDGQVTIITPDGVALLRRDFDLVAARDRFAASTWVPEVPWPPAEIGWRKWAGRVSRRLPPRLSERVPAGLVPRTAPRPRRDDRVEVASVALPGMELRVSHLWTLDGGFIRDGGLAASGPSAPETTLGDGWCLVKTGDLISGVVGLHGWRSAGLERGVEESPFGRFSAVPFIDGQLADHETLLVTAHFLGADPVDPEAVRRDVRIDQIGSRAVVIDLPDGEQFLVQMFCPARMQLKLGGELLDGSHRYARRSPDGTGDQIEG